MRIDYARRRARGGTGVIPPNNTQWEAEHHALDVREDLGLRADDPLPEITRVFQTLLPHVTVAPLGQLCVAKLHVNYLRGPARGNWSGLSVTMDDGSIWVVYNDVHVETRARATLMEEFFHIYLGHPSAAVRLLPCEGSLEGSYNARTEREAYACGAAALLPYAGLRQLLAAHVPVSRIAAHYVVSPQLVTFRLKVTRLYRSPHRWRR